MSFFLLHVLGNAIPSTVNPVSTFRVRTPGRRLKRRLETVTSEGADPQLEKHLKQSITTCFPHNMECMLFRHTITRFAFSLLVRLQHQLNFKLTLAFDKCSDGGRLTAFCIIPDIPPGSEFTEAYMYEYLRNFSLTLPHSTQLQPNVEAHICDFPCLDLLTSSLVTFALHSFEENWNIILGSDVCEIIYAFVGEADQAVFSRKLWKFLFRSSVFSIPRPRVENPLLSKLFHELQAPCPSLYNNRRHKLFSAELGRAYWWDSLKKATPFVSNLDPPSLSALRTILTYTFPQLPLCPDMLTSEYRKSRDNLPSHRDRALIEYLNRPEFVILFFLGSSRPLQFTPPPRFAHKFREEIICDSSNLLIMSPLANDLFYHSKLRSRKRENHHALTLAFREGIRITEGFTLYPLLRQHFPNLCSEAQVIPIYGHLS